MILYNVYIYKISDLIIIMIILKYLNFEFDIYM